MVQVRLSVSNTTLRTSQHFRIIYHNEAGLRAELSLHVRLGDEAGGDQAAGQAGGREGGRRAVRSEE